MRPIRSAALALVGVVALAACSGTPAPASGGSRAVSAVAALYPLAYAVQRVGGERVAVADLTPPGVEPHDLELGARQTAEVVDADLLVHLDGLQPAVDELAAQVGERALDVATVVPLRSTAEASGAHEGGDAEPHAGAEEAGDAHEGENGGKDPHLWLDPTRFAQLGDAVAARLAELDPDGAAGYRERAAALRGDLERLDGELREGLARCRRREMVVSHEAFGYLAARYGLEQVGIAGFTPDAEPSAARVAEAARAARRHGVTTVFFETLVSPAVAETVAREVGARTAVLDPLEGRPDQGDYLSAMRANLAALRAGLGCT